MIGTFHVNDGEEQCMAQNMWKIFHLVPSKKPLTRENWDKLSVYFSNLSDKIYNYIYQKKPFGTWQFGKICVLVNFITQKSKSKHLVCLSFLWWQFFEGTRETILYIFRTYVVLVEGGREVAPKTIYYITLLNYYLI